MILFEEDFYNQRAIVHYTTTNKSAIRMAKILKGLGIKNNKFMLALSQPELADIDPHNLKDDSIELKQRIAFECKINPWYYFREVVRVPAAGHIDGIQYIFNRANVCLTWCFYNSINIMLVIPRQIGKSIGTQSITSQVQYISGEKYPIGAFAKDQSLVQQNVIRLKEIKEGLPNYILDKSAKDIDNKEGLDYKALNNSYKTFVAQKDPRAAEKQGRGESFCLLHFDEFAWYSHIKLSFAAATGSLGAAKQQALERGLPAGIILTTTAGRVDDPNGKFAYDYMMDCLPFTEKLYDCKDRSVLNNLVKENSPNSSIYAEFSWRQLGKSEDWYRENTAGKDKDTIAMDYDNKWLAGKVGKALPTELLDSLLQIEPLDFSQHDTFIMRWYVSKEVRNSEEFKNKTFISGSDISDNVGIDFSTFTVVDPSTLSVVAVCRTNTSNLTLFAQFVADFISDHRKTLYVPERNRNGAAFIDNLIIMLAKRGINPFKNIYNTFIQEFTSDTDRHPDELDYTGTDRKFLGFITGSGTRGVLYSSTLVSAVQYCKDKIFDSIIISELKGLVIRNGRIDHDVNGHDDQLMSWLLIMYVIMYGKNLHMYNIDVSQILRNIDLSGKEVDPVEKQNQIYLRNKIEELEGRLSSASEYVKTILERQIHSLKERLNPDINVTDGVAIRLQVEKENYKDGRPDPQKFMENVMAFNQACNMFFS